MTCQRPGCSNEVGLRVDTMSPKRFCDDPECRRLRHNEASNRRNYRVAGKLPPFRRKGPKKNKPKFAPGATIAPERSMSRPTEKVAAEAKAGAVPDGKLSLVDRNAPMAGIDRGTREGFKRYMEERPFYFEWVFPGMTIKEAWGQIHGQ